MPQIRRKKILPVEKEILAFPDHYVVLPGKIAYATLKTVAKVDEDFDGAKTLKKGTVIKMDADGTVTAAGDADGNGIVFNTIKLDDYDESDVRINVAVLMHGVVRKDRLDGADKLGNNKMIVAVNK